MRTETQIFILFKDTAKDGDCDCHSSRPFFIRMSALLPGILRWFRLSLSPFVGLEPKLRIEDRSVDRIDLQEASLCMNIPLIGDTGALEAPNRNQ